MKYIKQFALIALITFLGECMNYLIPLPIPGSIYGMVLLFLLLLSGILKIEQVEESADLLLGVMPIFFISPTVSLMSSITLIQDSLIAVIIICLVSTIVVMAITGLVSQKVIRYDQRRKK